MSRMSKAEYIGEKRPSAATARPTSSPNCRASALSGELDRGHAGGGMGAFRPTPWLRPRGRPCALHHPVRSPLRPNAEYSNQQLLADVWCYPVGTAFHRRPYHVTAPVGTAFHRRPRLAVERQPYQNAEVLQLPCRSVKTGQTCFLTFINEPRTTNHEPRKCAILPALEKQEKK